MNMIKGFTGRELYALKDRGTGLTQEELVMTVLTYEWAIKRMKKYASSATKAEERLKKAAVHIAVAADLINHQKTSSEANEIYYGENAIYDALSLTESDAPNG